jgi:hypothetical protein
MLNRTTAGSLRKAIWSLPRRFDSFGVWLAFVIANFYRITIVVVGEALPLRKSPGSINNSKTARQIGTTMSKPPTNALTTNS